MIDLAMIQRRLPIRKIDKDDELSSLVHIFYNNDKVFEWSCVCIDLNKCTATVWATSGKDLIDISIPPDMKIGIEFNNMFYF